MRLLGYCGLAGWLLLGPLLAFSNAFAARPEIDAEDVLTRFLSEDKITVTGVLPGDLFDSDQDQVNDQDDNCPDTPGGTPIDECGCPIDLCKIDSDKDGVPDCRDKCRRTLRGLKVDKDGCPLPINKRTRVRLDVKFQFAQANIQTRYVADLERLKALLIRFPTLKVTLEGHTDAKGSDAYNLALSEARARICRSYVLGDTRIARDRVRAIGYGERWPVASNRSEDGRSLNRRTVAEIDIEFAIKSPNDRPPPALSEGEIPLDALPALVPPEAGEAPPAAAPAAQPTTPPPPPAPAPVETRTPQQIIRDLMLKGITLPPPVVAPAKAAPPTSGLAPAPPLKAELRPVKSRSNPDEPIQGIRLTPEEAAALKQKRAAAASAAPGR